MANSYFRFKQFTIHQEHTAMKVTTDSCVFGAWVAKELQNSSFESLLDIGAGTGLLSLMCAQKNPSLHIDAIEIEKNAFEQSKENFKDSSWQERITAHYGDIENYDFGKKFDAVICNPPFYEKELKSPGVNRRLAHHEGVSLAKLVRVTHDLLNKEGRYFFLLPFKRKNELDQLFGNTLSITEMILLRHSHTHSPLRIFITGKKWDGNKQNYTTSDIHIKDGDSYSEQFRQLLKDYYLQL